MPDPIGNPTTASPGGKPSKPYALFPLFPHATKRWAKKIRGKLHYFGSWADGWEAALDAYERQKDALHAGRTPRPDADAATVKDVVNAFLNHKKGLLDAGELSPHTWVKYRTVSDLVVANFGRNRLASDLAPEDFADLRKHMAAKWGVHRLADMIQHVRSVFKHGFEARLLAVPVCFGPGFKRPTKKAARLHRAGQGAKLLSADEVRKMVEAASTPLKAMVLLGVNCAFGNSDCGNLPVSAVDLEGGWIEYPRPKTGIARRCFLWPETVAALRDALTHRPAHKNEQDAALFFITKHGSAWNKSAADHPVSKQTKRLLKQLGIDRKGLNFYVLRHVFRTVADESRDQPAVDFVMGHADPSMAGHYRERISGERLRAVSEYVRNWLFKDT